MTPQARVQAAIELLDEIITAAREGGAAADTLIARYFKARRYAGSKDRRAVRELVYSTVRLCGDRPSCGRAAILCLVKERPYLAALFDGSNHGPEPIVEGEDVASSGAVPPWLVPHLVVPAQQEAEQTALLERAPLDLRANRLKASIEQAQEAFPDAKRVAGAPDAVRLPEGSPVEKSDAYRNGLVDIQDAGSQSIAAACEPAVGMTVIDLCAGAGGKAFALAAAMKDEGRLIAADVNRERLSRLPDRAARLGVTGIEILLMDAGKEERSLADLQDAADVVLVDAPCSGTGTWRRNPEARWRLNEDRLSRLVSEQSRILDFAAPLVKSGGRLVYAVCALTEAEGSGQIDSFLCRHEGWKAMNPVISLGREYGKGRLLTPAHDGTDGFFIAVLLKS